MRPKLVALIAASSVSVGWLLASLIVPPVAKLQGLPARVEPRPAPLADDAVAPYTEQLHLRLKEAPSAPVPRRNPFVFAGRSAAPRASSTLAPPPSETETSQVAILPAPLVTGPRLRLTGVGSTGGVWTAVISDGATVHLVKVGETVNGYAVLDIKEDTVTVADASGAQWTLRMN
jgi:hypothetical protein